MSNVVTAVFDGPLQPADFLAAVERQQRIMKAIDDYNRGGDVVAAIERQERDMRTLEDFRTRYREIERLAERQTINQQ